MSILEKLKERKSVKQYVASADEAMEIFERQRSGIKAIKDTTGFKEIVAYWERQKKASETRFDSAIKENKVDILARARYVEAKKFLVFLENVLESSK